MDKLWKRISLLPALIGACLLLSACGGGGSAPGGSNAGGSGGGGGSDPFASKTFNSVVWIGKSSQAITLKTGIKGALSGSFTVTSAARAGSNFSGTYDKSNGAFNASGTLSSVAVTLTGTLPKEGIGGLVKVHSGGKDSSAEFGVQKVNTLYFRSLGVTDSYYGSQGTPLPLGYIEGAGRRNTFTTYGGQTHPAYISALMRQAEKEENGEFSIIAFDGALDAGTISFVVPPATLYNDGTPNSGECRLNYSDKSLTYYGISGRIFIDYLDQGTHTFAFHTDSVVVRGSADLFGTTYGIGKFELHGNFVGNYSDSDLLGPLGQSRK